MAIKKSGGQNDKSEYEEFMRTTIGFVIFLVQHCQKAIEFSHVEKMFCLFVMDAETEMETNLFFNLLTHEIEVRAGRKQFLLPDKIRLKVFTDIFCNEKMLHPDQITLVGFDCFRKLFLILN